MNTKPLIFTIVLILMFSISSRPGVIAAQAQADIISSVLEAVREIRGQTDALSVDSSTARNIAVISDTILSEGADAFTLLDDLSLQIGKLSGLDGDPAPLETINELGRLISQYSRLVLNSVSKDRPQTLSEQITDGLYRSSPPDDIDTFDVSGQDFSYSSLLRNSEYERFLKEAQPDESAEEGRKLFKKISWAEIKGKIHKEILKLDVDADLKLLSFDIAKDISVGIGYKWGLEPSYAEGYFTRIDCYKVGANFKIGDMIQHAAGSTLPVYLNLKAGQQIISARQFKNQVKAAIAVPYNPLDLPINANKARKMDPGDFISIPAEMSLVVGASAGYGTGITASANVYYLVSGDFRINILKVDESRVRVKLIGMRRAGAGGGASVGYGISLFGIKILDNGIGSLLDTNIFRVNLSDIKGENFSVDYIFNLDSRDAESAYDEFLNANLKFRVLPTANPLESDENVTAEFFNNLAMTEELHLRDRSLAERDRSVTRVFKSSTFFEDKGVNVKIGFNLIKFIRGRRWLENRLSVFDADNIMSRYFVPVFQANAENKFLFGLFESRNTVNTYSLLSTDHEWKARSIDTFALTWNKYDKKHYPWQYEKTRQSLLNRLGPVAQASGVEASLPPKKERIDGFRWDMKIVFGEESAKSLLDPSVITDEIIWVSLREAMLALEDELYLWAGNDEDDPDTWNSFSTSKYGPAQKRLFNLFVYKNWEPDKWNWLLSFVKDYKKAVNQTGNTAKIKAFLELYKDTFYRDFLLRFSIEALRWASVPIDYSLNLNARGKGMPTVNFRHGNLALDDRLYQEINTVISHITDTSYDMFDIAAEAYQ